MFTISCFVSGGGCESSPLGAEDPRASVVAGVGGGGVGGACAWVLIRESIEIRAPSGEIANLFTFTLNCHLGKTLFHRSRGVTTWKVQ